MKIVKTFSAILLLSFITLLAYQVDCAQAQDTDIAEKVRSELERTDEVIMNAREVVQDSRSQKGRLKLETAQAIQDKAWESYRTRKAYGLAQKLTREARQEANQAIGMARLEVKAEARLSRIIEETMDRIVKVRDLIIESNIIAVRAVKLLEDARDMLEKSRLNANQYRYQLAMKLAENAHQRAAAAERQVRRLRSIKEMNERRLEFLLGLMERARERVEESQDPRALQQLHLAEEQLERAKELLQEGRYRAAKLAIEKCEKTFRSLIRRFRSQTAFDPETLLNEAYRLLERATEIISRREGEYSEGKGITLLEDAKKLINRAEGEIMDRHPDETRRLLREARKILRRAIEEDKEGLTREAIASMIVRAETARDEALILTQSCNVQGVNTLLERASEHLDKARAYLDEDWLNSAAAEAKIARNMYSRIKEICVN